jgi:hypothetical protein
MNNFFSILILVKSVSFLKKNKGVNKRMADNERKEEMEMEKKSERK